MRYAVVIEKMKSNYSAYVPDLPGCIATGSTIEEIEDSIRETIALHLVRIEGRSSIHPGSDQPGRICVCLTKMLTLNL